MKKFGFGKKSPAPGAGDNPYAQPPGQDDPYANVSAYQRAKVELPSGPKPGPRGGLPSGPGPNRFGGPPQPAMGAGPRPGPGGGGGYGGDRYGASDGYGSNRYGGGGGDDYGAPQRAGARGPAGYGGLGRTESYETEKTLVDDDSRSNLFAGAKERHQKQQKMDDSRDGGGGYGQPDQQQQQQQQQRSYGGGGGYGGGGRDELFSGARERAQKQEESARSGAYGDGGYGGYGEDRELTAEEKEEAEINDTKAQISQIKGESVQSTRRALQAGEAAMESSRAIMARLGAQGERLHNTEKNLDLSANHNKVAQDKTKELKTLNRSMFAVHVDNPFGAKARQEKRENDLLERHRLERDQRERTRQDAYSTNQRMETAFRDMSMEDRPQFQRNLANRSKYQFEADDEDDEKEDEIENNLGALEHVTGRLHQAGLAIGKEIDHQNRLIDRIGQKSDRVDDEVRLNRDRLARIK